MRRQPGEVVYRHAEGPAHQRGWPQFLVALLSQLSDRQIHDLFEVARVELRGTSADEWVRVFKRKRAEIAARHCTEPWSATAPFFFKTGPNRWLQGHSRPALTTMMNAVSLLGFTGVSIALAVLLTFAYRLRAGAALLILISANGMVNRSPIGQIRLCGRNTKGVRLINLREGDRVASLAVVAHEEPLPTEETEAPPAPPTA